MQQVDQDRAVSGANEAPSRPGARQRQTRTRQLLLTAARRLIIQGSRAAFTIDELTGAAGVAKGSFYNHFPDKEAIAEAVYREVREKEEAEVRAVNQGVADPVIRIARGMATYAQMAITAPEDAQILGVAPVNSRFLQAAVNAGLRDDLRAALGEGGIVAPSIEAAALLVVGQTAVLIGWLLDRSGQREAPLIAQQCIALTMVGLGLDHRKAQLIAAQAVDAIVREHGPQGHHSA